MIQMRNRDLYKDRTSEKNKVKIKSIFIFLWFKTIFISDNNSNNILTDYIIWIN